jgi:predicted dehydrogenase
MSETRRAFFRRAGGGAIVYKLVDSAPRLKAAGPNSHVGLGFIGTGIRGTILLQSFLTVPGVRPIIAADLYDGFLERAKELTKSEIATTKDYHAVLARKDVDAVVIATPDHWHRQMVLDALEAGKHVYIEKPMTWNIDQGKEVVAAAQKSGKVVQVGSGAGSSGFALKAREIIQSGALGKVNMVRLENNRNNPEGAWVYPIPPDASPQTIDWPRFIGPSPKRPFDAKVFFRWRCWWEYSGGVATDLFVHMLTQLHGMMDVPGPKSVVSQGGIYRWHDGRSVPDVMNSVFEYPEGFLADIYVNLGNSRGLHGTVVMGSEGTLMLPERGAGRGKLIVYPEPTPSEAQRYATICWPAKMRAQYYESLGLTADGRPKTPPPAPKQPREFPIERGPSHQESFILALREGRPVAETPVHGHHAAGAAHLANLSYRKGRRMHWDLKTGNVSEA